MKFGKIDYLNLLPFHVFMKRYLRYSQKQMSLRYGRGVPSKINAQFERREVDVAFISSIKAKKYRYHNIGIVAKREVQSVLLLESKEQICDSASATSNVLAAVLGLNGEVVIGDRALKMYVDGVDGIDLAKQWYVQHKLPFVFALLCYHTHKRGSARVASAFKKSSKRVPHYLLRDAAARSGVGEVYIREYLLKISYELDHNAHRSLRLFWSLSARLGKF